jgi:hypothetical protein
MPTTKSVPIRSLLLDLNNFRTVPQSSESNSVHSMISINPDWFWALMESILEDGYLPTENVIVLKQGGNLVVKEGNRRIGALKIIHGYLPKDAFPLPSQIAGKISKLPKEWKAANSEVPCAIYGPAEADVVDRIVTLTHGKGEKAGRDKWNAVAKARHNRDKSNVSEPALDLLEGYLREAKNLTPQQAERWGGEYPLSVLEEAMKRIAPRIGLTNARELANAYPKLKQRSALEDMIRDIGLETLTFELIRDKSKDFGEPYGGAATSVSKQSQDAAKQAQKKSPAGSSQAAQQAGSTYSKKGNAVALNDPRAVMRALRDFSPKGANRGKVVTLLEEARKLTLNKHPHAFCFLLRSMFEISAKAYCDDHKAAGGPKAVQASGDDRKLVDVLRDITAHLTKNNTDKEMKKRLHGAMTDLARAESILSVTSMNQLVHNPRFSVDETHISGMFHNIFPLLEEMNR